MNTVSRLIHSIHRRKRPFSDRRLIFKHGEFNISQTGISHQRQQYLADIFTTLIDLRWRCSLLLFVMAFISSWMIFATVWWAMSYSRGDIENSDDPQWQRCVNGIHGYFSAILFSIETQHTIGKTTRSPCHHQPYSPCHCPPHSPCHYPPCPPCHYPPCSPCHYQPYGICQLPIRLWDSLTTATYHTHTLSLSLSTAFSPCHHTPHPLSLLYTVCDNVHCQSGYGTRSLTDNCVEALIVLMTQATFGVVIQALMTGTYPRPAFSGTVRRLDMQS